MDANETEALIHGYGVHKYKATTAEADRERQHNSLTDWIVYASQTVNNNMAEEEM